MAVFEGTHGELLQGVSQQIARSRLEGQVSEQINMVSDPVLGLRRRQGAVIKEMFDSPQAEYTSVKAWRTDISGVPVELILETNSGKLRIKEGSKVTTLQSNYLKVKNIKDIRQASVLGSVYILNREHVPQGVKGSVPSGTKVGESGFATFLTGALNREFRVSVRITKGSSVKDFVGTYTTPKGAKPEDVNKITPEYIAEQIYNSLNTAMSDAGFQHIGRRRHNGIIMFWSAGNSKIRVLANASDLYVVTSNLGNLKDIGKLPEVVPDGVPSGITFSIGRDKGTRYYSFARESGAWKESSDHTGFKGIRNMPIELYWDVDKNTWVLNEEPFAGRLVGDEETNPDPDFVGWGITGIGSYQGRLVLLSGSWVWLSASGLPRIFYRTTVEELIDTDPIGVGSSSATSADFQYAINFNKDLIIFSAEHQAIIAGSNIALTPRTANVMVASTYTADISIEPVTFGDRTVMYPMPRSRENYGLLEMIPSPYTDSMYISTDVTEHIPTYLRGRCRIAVASTVGGIGLFGSTACEKTLYVHEYVWRGEEKVLKSWHRWKFNYPIADVFFDGDLVTIVFVNAGVIVTTTVDPKASTVSEDEVVASFVDFRLVLDVPESKVIKLPEAYRKFLDCECVKLTASHLTGNLKGYKIGSEFKDGNVTLNKSTTAKQVNLGIPYRSEVQPSPPIVKDWEGKPVTTNRLNLINYYCTTDNSGTYTVTVQDKARSTLDLEYDRTPIKWLSSELNAGITPLGGLSGDIIPCRVPAESSVITFYTEDIYELNIVSMEYVVLYNYRRQRR